MTLATTRRRRTAAVALAATSATLLALALVPTTASAVTVVPLGIDTKEVGLFAATGLEDVDARPGTLKPTSAQVGRVGQLGAVARWNRFGTPQSLIKQGGYLGTGYSTTDAVGAARTWLKQNAALFRLDAAGVSALELVNDSKLVQSNGHVVLFRQRFGELQAAVDGMVTVSVVQGKITYVSSSIAGTTATPSAVSLSAAEAWVKAAANVGRLVPENLISGMRKDAAGWTRFKVAGYAQEQQARVVALPMRDGTVRAVWEVNVVDVAGGQALAYSSFVDAQSSNVLIRHNRVASATENDSFDGSIPNGTTCGPMTEFDVDGDTKSIFATAFAAIPTNDIVLKLFKGSQQVAESDTATSPEVVTYTVGDGEAPGTFSVQVCPFGPAPTAPFTQPGNYVGTFSASDQAVPTGADAVPYPPKWKYFLSNPVPSAPATSPDNRKIGCWVTKRGATTVPDCNNPPSPLNNLAARAPWDYNTRTNTPTFTTEGNAAVTAEAWASPLTPGGARRPVSQDRVYGTADHPLQDFKDTWNAQKCNPATLTPAFNDNDVQAATTSLFSSHNRLHDWSYFLGFTEDNYNLQDNNFGNRADGMLPTAGELDPEIGNVQAGAIIGERGLPVTGRDNANQITLQDGTPGITNQYLFQPLAGAFYSPCVDGDYDMGIVGHEYNHAISNRMVGGPDEGLTSFQGGSMGESWGDQVALEYQFEHNYGLLGGTVQAATKAGQNHFVEGVYATGNKATGIRNYALNNNPLQYGDLGYDITGPEVHADGEPWSAVMIDVRNALVKKYNAKYPENDFALQRRCAQGNGDSAAPAAPLAPQFCPGNRRWMQMLFDSYLMLQPGTSMLDARDAMLASDVMRFNGANQAVLANTFAKRGYGQNANNDNVDPAKAGGESDQPKPDYTSKYATEGTLNLTANEFTSAGKGKAVKGTLYLGRYEARVTPVADTDTDTPLPSSIALVPGTYDFLFQAKGFGLTRFTQTITAGQVANRNVHLFKNLASKNAGAAVAGASAGSVNADKLIDDTEASNWAGIGPSGSSVDVTQPFVNVDLAGTAPVPVRSVKVSALLRPADGTQDQGEPQPDMSSGSRFTALRDFAIATCTQSATSLCNSTAPAGTPGSPYTIIYNSKQAIGGAPTTTGGATAAAAVEPDTTKNAAFDATQPRPLAPNLLLKSFEVPLTMATHVRLIALENQCTGTPEFAGEQDNDPTAATDCKTASTRDEAVRAAELEVFSFGSTVRPPGDPVVASTMTAPATVKPGGALDYAISYTNAGPQPSANATITDTLPAGVQFVSASNGGTYNATTRKVTWKLGTVAVNYTGKVTLKTKVLSTTRPTTVLLNQSQFAGALTFSAPAAAFTTVVP